MKRLALTFLGCIGLGVALVGTGCNRSERTADQAAPIRFAFVPQTDMEERYVGAYRALQAYMAPRLGRPVEIVQLDDANAAIEGLRAGKLDVCNFSPWPFLIAEKKAGLEALLLTMAPGGEPISYHSVLVTHPGTGLRTPEDMVRRARELTFAFEEPVSTSGHFAPRTYLHSLGVSPEKDFKRVLYGTDGVTNLLATRAGRLDVAALSDTSLQRAIARGRIREGEIVVLWKSPPILSTVIAVRAGLPEALKEKIARLLTDLPAASPTHWAEVLKQYSNPIVGYLPAPPAALDSFRRALRDVPGLQLSP
jgi:phosphonate transport system substrate-binding protein